MRLAALVWRAAEGARPRDARGRCDLGPVWGRAAPGALDPEALLQAAADPCADGARRVLAAKLALAAAEDVRKAAKLLREECERRDAARSETLAETIRLRDELASRRDACAAALKGLCARAGWRVEGGELVEVEPETLEETAGRLGLSAPNERTGWWERAGWRLLSILSGGPILGLGLGTLIGKLETLEPAHEGAPMLLWAMLGSAIVAAVGSCLYGLGSGLGESLVLAEPDASRSARRKAVLCGWALALLGAAFVAVESSVERFSLLRALRASTSFETQALGSADLFVVSLVVVLPSVACSALSGVLAGERRANLARLRAAGAENRRSRRRRPESVLAAMLLSALEAVEAEVRRLEERASSLASERGGPTESERQLLGDLCADALLASYRAEDELWGPRPDSNRLAAPAKVHPLGWRGLVSRFRRALGGG